MKIEKNIDFNIGKFLKKRNQFHRYASYDYCYNYFQQFARLNKISNLSLSKNLELGCLHLGMYLASWGMYRGSSHLLKNTSVKSHSDLIQNISNFDKKIWDIDLVDLKNNKAKKLILDLKELIINSYKVKPSEILISKIMMGIFGVIPALDTNFKKGFKYYLVKSKLSRQGISTICNNSLDLFYQFYLKYQGIINSRKIKTLDFYNKSNLYYKKAKVLDMACFTKGLELD